MIRRGVMLLETAWRMILDVWYDIPGWAQVLIFGSAMMLFILMSQVVWT